MIDIFHNKFAVLMEKRLVTSGLRAALNWIGPLLIAHGLVTEQSIGSVNVQAIAEYIIGTALPAISLWLSHKDGVKTETTIAVAASLPAGTSAAEAKAVTKEGHFKLVNGQLIINR